MATGRATPGERFTPAITDDPAPQGLGVYPYEYNERVTEIFSYSPPPDPATQGGAYGDIRSRPARVQIAGFFHPYDYVMEDRFVFADIGNLSYTQLGAWLPAGQMQPWDDRVNIEVPPAVAYGSLFSQYDAPYGYG